MVRNDTPDINPADKGTPDRYPTSTPPGLQAADHSWVLQAIMEMQKSLGGLEQAVKALTEQAKEQGNKLDKVSHDVTALRTTIKTAAAVLGALMAIVGLAIKFWSTS